MLTYSSHNCFMSNFLGVWGVHKFSKCCLQMCIRSWLVAFSLGLRVLFRLLTSFIVYHAIRDRLSSTESLILSIYIYIYIYKICKRISLYTLFYDNQYYFVYTLLNTFKNCYLTLVNLFNEYVYLI